jgi:hypothetical protein
MLRDESIRYQSWCDHVVKWNQLARAAGFTAQQKAALHEMLTWKWPGSCGKSKERS